MALTGTALQVFALLLTLAAFVAAVVLLPRWPGRRPLAVAARALSLVVVNALMLLTAGIALNAHYQFFADWTDLHNAVFGGQVAAQALHAGGPSNQGSATAARQGGTPSTPRPVDKVLTFDVHGAASGLSGTVLVTVPAGYDDPANAHRQYPVLETFPGYPSSPWQWYRMTDLLKDLETAATGGHVASAVTVSPQTEFPGGVDTECVNGGRSRPAVETWLTRDVPTWLHQHFRVRADRAGWATMGMSTGGWCAAMLTMLHPRTYAAAVVMAGYFEPEFTRTYAPFPKHSAGAAHYDLIALARATPPPVSLFVQTSRTDGQSWPSTRTMLAAARAPLSVDAVVLNHGGHRFSVWNPLLPRALAWLGSNVAGFRPSGSPAAAGGRPHTSMTSS